MQGAHVGANVSGDQKCRTLLELDGVPGNCEPPDVDVGNGA